jgi:hypothetical protein
MGWMFGLYRGWSCNRFQRRRQDGVASIRASEAMTQSSKQSGGTDKIQRNSETATFGAVTGWWRAVHPDFGSCIIGLKPARSTSASARCSETRSEFYCWSLSAPGIPTYPFDRTDVSSRAVDSHAAETR